MGTLTPCCKCGYPVTSCTLPAYCFECDPKIQAVMKSLRKKEEQEEQEVDEPIIVKSKE